MHNLLGILQCKFDTEAERNKIQPMPNKHLMIKCFNHLRLKCLSFATKLKKQKNFYNKVLLYAESHGVIFIDCMTFRGCFPLFSKMRVIFSGS